jgi:hypothetical protein
MIEKSVSVEEWASTTLAVGRMNVLKRVWSCSMSAMEWFGEGRRKEAVEGSDQAWIGEKPMEV